MAASLNYFYSINVNDRVRFPILGDAKKEPLPNDTVPMDLGTPIHEDELKDTSNFKKLFRKSEEDSYFEAFKQTNCEKGLYCDEILKFLDGFFQTTRSRMGSRPWRSLQAFLSSFTTYVHNHSNEFRELTDTMNTKRLITPYIELDLPVNIIEEFNQLEEGDPRIHLYQLNPVWGPAIKEFGFFWERYESTNEVLCMFVWSTIDQAVVPMPAVGLNPYPLCWVCDKGFGTIACSRCRVAKYCSKECSQQDWIRHGGPVCDLMASSLRRVKQLTFKRPPSPQSPASSSPASTSPPVAVAGGSLPTTSPSPTPSPPSTSPISSSSPSPSPSPSLSPPHSPTSYLSPPPDLDADPPFILMEHI